MIRQKLPIRQHKRRRPRQRQLQNGADFRRVRIEMGAKNRFQVVVLVLAAAVVGLLAAPVEEVKEAEFQGRSFILPYFYNFFTFILGSMALSLVILILQGQLSA